MERRAKDHEKCALRGHFRDISLILLAFLYVSLKEHALPLGLPRLILGKDKQDVTAQCTSRDPGKPEVTSGFLSLHSQAGDSWDWHTASFSRWADQRRRVQGHVCGFPCMWSSIPSPCSPLQPCQRLSELGSRNVQVQAVHISWPEEGKVESAHPYSLTGLTQDLSQRKKIPDLGNQDACELG